MEIAQKIYREAFFFSFLGRVDIRTRHHPRFFGVLGPCVAVHCRIWVFVGLWSHLAVGCFE